MATYGPNFAGCFVVKEGEEKEEATEVHCCFCWACALIILSFPLSLTAASRKHSFFSSFAAKLLRKVRRFSLTISPVTLITYLPPGFFLLLPGFWMPWWSGYGCRSSTFATGGSAKGAQKSTRSSNWRASSGCAQRLNALKGCCCCKFLEELVLWSNEVNNFEASERTFRNERRLVCLLLLFLLLLPSTALLV